MTTNEQKSPQGQQAQQKEQTGAQRSENLLPADGADDGADDGRFEIAEEVSLDEQSDTARRVGKAPAGATLDAMGDALRPDDDTGNGAGKSGGA